MITVLIPAHNEEETLGRAIDSVKRQSFAVDDIVVIADNCTDRTVEVATAAGATVVETAGNKDKKAGALNQVLDSLLRDADDGDRVLVMDADSFLDRRFVATAAAWLDRTEVGRDGTPRRYGGIGGTFRGRAGEAERQPGVPGLLQRWVETAQCNEYARYARDVRRKRGDVLVLTGTATLFSVEALRAVVAGRTAGRLPWTATGEPKVYDTAVLTEDNELTFALRHAGWLVRSPAGCTLTTEVMASWRALHRQRLRWKRGAVENLVQYGVTRHTGKHWGYQVVGVLGIVVTALYLGSVGWALAVDHGLSLRWMWLAVTAVFVVERTITVRSRGPRQMFVAATLVVELAYDLFLQATHLKALADAGRG
ncbi:MAG TPA: glycosyltransferase family 2 protein, partial [Micromonosporaceae bacterium]|nr:glycosyltransferase family 2 protein [Micromonosporaceae bacterium]